MSAPIKKKLAYSSQKLLGLLQARLLRPKPALSKLNLNQHFSVPHFDADSERLFRQERQTETLNTLKIALLFNAGCLLALLALNAYNGNVSKIEFVTCLLIVLILSIFYIGLHLHPHPESKMNLIAKLSAALSLAGLTVTVLVTGNPVFYTHVWIGLFPIYVFTYGQLFMDLADAIQFGLLTTVALPLSGYLAGIEAVMLIPSLMILLIVNIFGFCTRHQLEVYTGNLFRQRRNAENVSGDKTQFLVQLSHNLRQPLQAMSCYTSVLDNSFADKPDDPLQQVISKLGAAIDELHYAFNHILDISNLEAGRQIPKLAAVDINTLLASLESQFAPQAAEQGLKLKVLYRSRPPYTIYSDVCILSQIIGNLIDNAIKYTTSGWIIITVVKMSGDRLKLHVRDSGTGIAEELCGDIFKAFLRCHRRQADPQTHGLGIGLAYALKATECLPGHCLQAHSRPQQGSDFQLSLPVIDALPQHPHLAGSFVFIADSDNEALEALSEQLAARGCLVQQASCKAQIQAFLAENCRPPDLLVSNFHLDNGETAYDIIAAIQADSGPVPTLILTAEAIPDEHKAKWPKNTLLLRKPANETVLMEAMIRAMAKAS